MGQSQRRKGKRIENELVHKHRDLGIDAERVPLSGSAGGRFAGDLVIDGRFKAEVKARSTGEGFKRLEAWLGDHDMIFLRRDRAEPLVVLPWRTYADLLARSAQASLLKGGAG